MALSTRKKVVLAELSLLLCGFVWGAGFVVTKNSLNFMSVNWFLGVRFVLSALVLCTLFFRRVVRADKRTLLGGFLSGCIIYAAFLAQTVGLNTTTAGNSAFLTVIYVVFVPFFQWAAHGRRPGLSAVIAAIGCMAGVGIIALNTGLAVREGDALTLLCGMLYAAHIVLVAHYTRMGADIEALTCYQFITMGLISLTAAFLTEQGQPMRFTWEAIGSMAYLVLLCTVFGMGVQNHGLRYVPAPHMSLLLSTEAPFGVLSGILFLGEPFTLRFLVGAALIAGSILYSELSAGAAQKHTPADQSLPAAR